MEVKRKKFRLLKNPFRKGSRKRKGGKQARELSPVWDAQPYEPPSPQQIFGASSYAEAQRRGAARAEAEQGQGEVSVTEVRVVDRSKNVSTNFEAKAIDPLPRPLARSRRQLKSVPSNQTASSFSMQSSISTKSTPVDLDDLFEEENRSNSQDEKRESPEPLQSTNKANSTTESKENLSETIDKSPSSMKKVDSTPAVSDPATPEREGADMSPERPSPSSRASAGGKEKNSSPASTSTAETDKSTSSEHSKDFEPKIELVDPETSVPSDEDSDELIRTKETKMKPLLPSKKDKRVSFSRRPSKTSMAADPPGANRVSTSGADPPAPHSNDDGAWATRRVRKQTLAAKDPALLDKKSSRRNSSKAASAGARSPKKQESVSSQESSKKQGSVTSKTSQESSKKKIYIFEDSDEPKEITVGNVKEAVSKELNETKEQALAKENAVILKDEVEITPPHAIARYEKLKMSTENKAASVGTLESQGQKKLPESEAPKPTLKNDAKVAVTVNNEQKQATVQEQASPFASDAATRSLQHKENKIQSNDIAEIIKEAKKFEEELATPNEEKDNQIAQSKPKFEFDAPRMNAEEPMDEKKRDEVSISTSSRASGVRSITSMGSTINSQYSSKQDTASVHSIKETMHASPSREPSRVYDQNSKQDPVEKKIEVGPKTEIHEENENQENADMSNVPVPIKTEVVVRASQRSTGEDSGLRKDDDLPSVALTTTSSMLTEKTGKKTFADVVKFGSMATPIIETSLSEEDSLSVISAAEDEPEKEIKTENEEESSQVGSNPTLEESFSHSLEDETTTPASPPAVKKTKIIRFVPSMSETGETELVAVDENGEPVYNDEEEKAYQKHFNSASNVNGNRGRFVRTVGRTVGDVHDRSPLPSLLNNYAEDSTVESSLADYSIEKTVSTLTRDYSFGTNTRDPISSIFDEGTDNEEGSHARTNQGMDSEDERDHTEASRTYLTEYTKENSRTSASYTTGNTKTTSKSYRSDYSRDGSKGYSVAITSYTGDNTTHDTRSYTVASKSYDTLDSRSTDYTADSYTADESRTKSFDTYTDDDTLNSRDTFETGYETFGTRHTGFTRSRTGDDSLDTSSRFTARLLPSGTSLADETYDDDQTIDTEYTEKTNQPSALDELADMAEELRRSGPAAIMNWLR